jgi:hypothetical protein
MIATRDEFAEIFSSLKLVFQPYIPNLVVVNDTENNYYLDTHRKTKNKKPLFFGAVIVGKAYVSFHLMPVYMYTDLLDGISPELKKHMQGKSCFNFRKKDDRLFNELAELTRAAFARVAADYKA